MRTSKELTFSPMGFNGSVTIPAGTLVTRATNLPEDSEIKFWVEPWEGCTEYERRWCETYGFGLRRGEVI